MPPEDPSPDLTRIGNDLIEQEKSRMRRMLSGPIDPDSFTITRFPPPVTLPSPNCFMSTGDYWWPNPDTKDGLPYIRRDGETNPDGFYAHRRIMRAAATTAAAMAVDHHWDRSSRSAGRAKAILSSFFLDPATRMLPSLEYGQAIPGICEGREIGIIDTLHLVEVPLAVDLLAADGALDEETVSGMKEWFGHYLAWLLEHPFGLKERATGNNHSTAYALQVTTFARFVGRRDALEEMRAFLFQELLPQQMSADGSFPLELERTKPYGYSIFNLDCFSVLCHLLSLELGSLWEQALPDGRCLKRGVEFLYPFVNDKTNWPYRRDVACFDDWPSRPAFLLLAGIWLKNPQWLDLWQQLTPTSETEEIERNEIMHTPLLWLATWNKRPSS